MPWVKRATSAWIAKWPVSVRRAPGTKVHGFSLTIRAPNFFELYSSGTAQEDLSFEVNQTAELNYVFRIPKTAARATLFYSRLKDQPLPVSRRSW